MAALSPHQHDATDANVSPTPATVPGKGLSRRIVGGTAWSLVGRFGSMGSLFAANVILANSLNTDDYSAYLAALSLTPFLATLVTAGTPYTVIRVLRSGHADRVLMRRIIGSAVILTLICCALMVPALYAASHFFPNEPKWFVIRHLPAMLLAWITLSAVCVISANFLQGVDDFRTASLIGARSGGLVPNLAALAAIFAAATMGTISLTQTIGYQLLGYVAATALAAVAIPASIRRTAAKAATPAVDQSSYSVGWYFTESWPNLLNQLIGMALVELDLFWVACLADESTIAEYGVVRNLRLLVMAPLMVGAVALAPFVTELHAKGDHHRLERMLRGTATLFAIPSLIALLGMLVFPELIIRLSFGSQFVNSSTALQIASLGCIVFVLSGSNGLTLTMTGRHRDLLVCGLIGLMTYAAISPWLVSSYGVVGAATAFTIQMVVVNVLATLQVYRTIGVWTLPHWSWQAVREEAKGLLRRDAGRK